MHIKKIIMTALLFTLFLGPSVARAGDEYDSKKGDCDKVFENYKKESLEKITNCTQLWETYKNVKGLSKEQTAFVAKPFYRLYLEGDDKSSDLAKGALERLGITAEGRTKTVKSILSERPYPEKYNPQVVDKKQSEKAAKEIANGVKAWKKKDFNKALDSYEKAVALDPRSEKALYNAACMHSQLGNEKMAVQYLWHIKDLGTPDGAKRLKAARTDPDFDPIRNTRGFKSVTGLCKIKLVNGLIDKGTEFGDEEVKNIKATIEALGNPVSEVGKDKYHREFPIVFFKMEYKVQALFYQELVNHPKAVIYPIDFDTDFDIIISWGDDIKVGQDGQVVPPKPRVVHPEDLEGGIDKVAQKQDDYLDKPEEYSTKVDKVLNKPDEVEQKVDNILDRPSQTLDKIKETGDKADKLIKKLQF